MKKEVSEKVFRGIILPAVVGIFIGGLVCGVFFVFWFVFLFGFFKGIHGTSCKFTILCSHGGLIRGVRVCILVLERNTLWFSVCMCMVMSFVLRFIELLFK